MNSKILHQSQGRGAVAPPLYKESKILHQSQGRGAVAPPLYKESKILHQSQGRGAVAPPLYKESKVLHQSQGRGAPARSISCLLSAQCSTRNAPSLAITYDYELFRGSQTAHRNCSQMHTHEEAHRKVSTPKVKLLLTHII